MHRQKGVRPLNTQSLPVCRQDRQAKSEILKGTRDAKKRRGTNPSIRVAIHNLQSKIHNPKFNPNFA